MNIAMVLGSRTNGGAETFFVALAVALQAAGIGVSVTSRHSPDRLAQLRAGGVANITTLPFLGSWDVYTQSVLSRQIDRRGAALALTFMSRATALTRPQRAPVVGRLGGYYDLKSYQHCRHLVVNTPDLVTHVERGGWPSDRVSLIPNFTRPPTDGPPVARASLDTPAEVPLLLSLGRLHPVKGHDITLTALAQVPDAYLWIAGDGPDRSRLEQLAQDLGVAGRVRFLGWRDDSSALLRAADVCVFPSRAEPFGNVIPEAWANQVPVIAASAYGPRWLIRDGADGMLVPIDDAPALSDAIRGVLADSAARTGLVEQGRVRYQQTFTTPVAVAAYRALFDRLAGSGAADG